MLLVLHIRKVERSKQAVKMKRKKTSVEAKCKFYAVKKGHNPGIYTTWEDCRAQVLGYRGNRYKSFGSQLEAEQYLAAAANSSKQKAVAAMKSDVPKKMTTVKNGMSIESPPPPAGLVKVKRNSRQHFPSKSSPETSSSSTAVVGGSSATVNSSKQTVLTLLDVPKIKIKPPPRKSPKSPVLVKMKHNHSPTKSSLEKIQWSSSSTTESPNFSSITEDVYQVEYDGASKRNPGRAGAGALVRHPDGSVVCELKEGLGIATNNVAEYRAFILGLRGALTRGIYRVRVQGDSKLVCEQVQGKWKINQPTLAILCKEAQYLIQNFLEFSIRHVDREINSAADQLANEAVALPETPFVSLCSGRRAVILAGPQGKEAMENKTYGSFDSLRTSQFQAAYKSYCLGFQSRSLVRAQGISHYNFTVMRIRPFLMIAVKPRMYNSHQNWFAARRCLGSMAIRLLL